MCDSKDSVLFVEVAEALAKCIMNSDFVSYLKQSEKLLLLEEGENSICEPKVNIKGYPRSPFIRELAGAFLIMMESGSSPLLQTPINPVFDESAYLGQREENVKLIQRQLQGARTLWNSWSLEQRARMFSSVLSRLRRRGLLDMLQMRRTVGTLEVLPIPRHILIEACKQLHCEGSQLTVCGRAFTKHAARDSTSWWGKVVGNDETKNNMALSVVNRILDNAVWINVHQLPGSIPTLEVRTEEGYGLRFDYEPLRFRGFLEPYFADGVMTGFKH